MRNNKLAPLAEQANLNAVVMFGGRRSWLIGGSADEAVELKRTGRWAEGLALDEAFDCCTIVSKVIAWAWSRCHVCIVDLLWMGIGLPIHRNA